MKLAISLWSFIDYENNVEKLPYTKEELKIVLREQRDVLLKESDWTVGVDSPLPIEAQEEWKQWRQEMRDITDNVVLNDGDQCVDIPIPPSVGRPKTWINLDYDFLMEQRAKLVASFNADNVIPPAPVLPDIVD